MGDRRPNLIETIGDGTIFTRNDYDDSFARDDTLGGRISFARDVTKLTMAQAARRLGVQTTSWNAWECDRSVPRSDRLTMMAGILGVSPSWLLSGIGSGPLEPKEGDDDAALLRELQRMSADARASQKRVQEIIASVERRGQV